MASFYAKKFHGKLTASGETFDMYKMTAAHKTLPFGTIVKVTNLTNNESIVVKINDRGPFVANRVLDLSYAAAKKLGYINKGLARVKAEVIKLGDNSRRQASAANINEEEAPAENTTTNNENQTPENTSAMVIAPNNEQSAEQRASGRLLRIQLGAFKSKENAQQHLEKLKTLGITAEVVEVRSMDHYYYKVYTLEKFRELSKAMQVLDTIRAKNVECFIIGQYYVRD